MKAQLREMVRKDTLDRNTMLQFVFPGDLDSIFYQEKKREIKSDVGYLSYTCDYPESLVCYIFVRLWMLGYVDRYNFVLAYQKHKLTLVPKFIREYDRI